MTQLERAKNVFALAAPAHPVLKKCAEELRTIVREKQDGTISANSLERLRDIVFGIETFLISMTKE
jgi:hypothetical protein